MGPLTWPAARPHGSTAEVISGVNLVSRQLHAATRHRRSGTLQFASGVAEREGFEPPIRLPVCRISSAVLSTTQPPLQAIVQTSDFDADLGRELLVCYPFATIWPLSRASVAPLGPRRQRERR